MMFIVNLLFLCLCVAQLCTVTKDTKFTETNIAQVYFTLNGTPPEFYLDKQLKGNSTQNKIYCAHLFDYEKFMQDNKAPVGRILCTPCDLNWVIFASYGVGFVSKLATMFLILCGVLGVLFILLIFGVERIN